MGAGWTRWKLAALPGTDARQPEGPGAVDGHGLVAKQTVDFCFHFKIVVAEAGKAVQAVLAAPSGKCRTNVRDPVPTVRATTILGDDSRKYLNPIFGTHNSIRQVGRSR